MMNVELIKIIRTLEKVSRERNQKIWKALSEDLDKSKRSRVAVNLSRINRYTKPGEIIAVPGKVLASGKLDHPVTIAAFQFSETAKKKIKLAEGETLTLNQLLEQEINPSKIRIIK
jgi:large subunit ribosomal protein L18e